MNKLLFLLASITFFLGTAHAQVRVVDSYDGSAVAYANVYGRGGAFLGTTDIDGLLPQKASGESRISLSHINYHSLEVATDTLNSGIIAMQAALHSLDTVAVTAASRDYVVVSAYVRQYHIGDSLPASYCEGNYDFYFPVDGGRAKRHVQQQREVFSKQVLADKDKVLLYGNDKVTMKRETNFMKMLKRHPMPDSTGTVVIASDRRFGVTKVSRDDERQICVAYVDSMFTEKPFTFNFLGIHFQITGCFFGETYDISHGQPNYKNLLRSYDKFQMRLWLDGRKGHVTPAEQIVETYVTSVGYASKAEMKEAMKQKAKRTVDVPADVPALPKPLQEAVDQMEAAK